MNKIFKKHKIGVEKNSANHISDSDQIPSNDPKNDSEEKKEVESPKPNKEAILSDD